VSSSRPARVLRLGALAVVVAALLSAVGAAPSSPASPTSEPLIEFWDGTSWTQQVSPNPNGSAILRSVSAVSATGAWAVGAYYTRSGPRALAAHWDGSLWQQVEMPPPRGAGPFDLYGVAAISARNGWAVGWWYGKKTRSLIEHWDGSRWRMVPSPSPGQDTKLSGIAAMSPRDVWAVGSYSTFPEGASPVTGTLVLHWNGTTWKRIPSPSPGTAGESWLYGVAAVSHRSVWAVGEFRTRANGHRSYQTLVLHWNGKTWKQVRSVNPGGDRFFDGLYGVAALGRRNVWAVGGYSNGKRWLPLVERWNGRAWHSIRPAPSSCPYSSQTLTALAPLAPDNLWAAGSLSGPSPCTEGGDTIGQALAEHWDGRAWSVSPVLSPLGAFYGIAAATPQAVWAVGRLYSQ
jgi:hypothetical protein